MTINGELHEATSLKKYVLDVRAHVASAHFETTCKYLHANGDIRLREAVMIFASLPMPVQFVVLSALGSVRLEGTVDLLLSAISRKSDLCGVAPFAIGQFGGDDLLGKMVALVCRSRSQTVKCAALNAIGHLMNIENRVLAIETCATAAFQERRSPGWMRAVAISSLSHHLSHIDRRTKRYRQNINTLLVALQTETDPFVLSSAALSVGSLGVTNALSLLKRLARTDRRQTGNCTTVASDCREAIRSLHKKR